MRRALLALVAVALLVGGCGLSEDGQPRAIAPDNLPPDLLDPNAGSSTSTLPTGTAVVTVYFLEEVGDRVRLSPVERDVNDPTNPGDRIAALFAQPTEAETETGLTTTIPADTVLLDVVENPESDELVLFLSPELFAIEGEELARAFAQIVWTVTEPDGGGFRSVRFVVDGEPIRALDAEGAEQEGAVTRADYSAVRPPEP